ncbi:hypothetical protein GOP47_0010952 [Adiantum capillus-veneris]|uniref:Uncharacterized protein n=1 Tax=Adiantum capillus-veneris TaxID=13818 RepID=A0A9D4UW17_ADICA|nr:hypothetical protein GOP47_0010952 [Adiantum capillus-veneris]
MHCMKNTKKVSLFLHEKNSKSSCESSAKLYGGKHYKEKANQAQLFLILRSCFAHVAFIISALDPDSAQLGATLLHATWSVDLSDATLAFTILLVVNRHAGAAAHIRDANGALVVEPLTSIPSHEEGVGRISGTAGAIEGLNLGCLSLHDAH